jgi:hypothetical protein
MNRDTLLLTFVVFLMIAALTVTAIPTAKRLSDLLSSPVKKIQAGQMMKA